MSDPSVQPAPLRLKYLRPRQVRDALSRDPRLIVPVGTTEQHGPHLPIGADTILIEQLADNLSAEFRVLRAPTVEYGVNAFTRAPYPGNAAVRRKTLHRFMNDLVGSWEEGGVQEFIILTAHGHDPHQEALTTLRTHHAKIRTVDIFTVRFEGEDADQPFHGGELDTSLLLHVDGSLVNLKEAEDFVPRASRTRAWRLLARRGIPPEGPGSVGRPSRSTAQAGQQLYEFIYERIASRVFGRPVRELATPRI
jgi:creatinine amidohydrolase